jgi:hypothetical protein
MKPTMTEIQIPYSMQLIESDAQRKWTDYKKEGIEKERSLHPGELLFPVIERYVNQTDATEFANFERASVILKTGYHAEFMR